MTNTRTQQPVWNKFVDEGNGCQTSTMTWGYPRVSKPHKLQCQPSLHILTPRLMNVGYEKPGDVDFY